MCTWFMGSQDEEGRCGAVTRGRLLAHMSKPKGRAACLRTHLGPIRNTSHRNTHARTHKPERDTHACTHTHWLSGSAPPSQEEREGWLSVSGKPWGYHTELKRTGWFGSLTQAESTLCLLVVL